MLQHMLATISSSSSTTSSSSSRHRARPRRGKHRFCSRASAAALGGAAALCCLLLLLGQPAGAAPLDVVNRVGDIWQDIALQAAEATLRAIQRQTGLADVSLRDVPLDSLRVFVGTSHHIVLQLGRQEFELTINSQPPHIRDEDAEAAAAAGGGAGGAAAAAAAGQLPALPAPAELSSTALAEYRRDPFSWQRQHLQLPEVTLAGPLELVFSRPTDLSMWLPHATEATAARRLLLGPGTALTLRQLASISLRRPLALPTLPGSYLADVWAHMKLGEPEPAASSGSRREDSVAHAPGVLFLASELFRSATNASLELGSRQLLSFEVEPAGAAVTAVAASTPGECAAPAMRLRKLAAAGGASSKKGGRRQQQQHEAGAFELSLRDRDQAAAARAAAAAAAGEGGVAPGTLAATAWAWPLPLVGMGDAGWLPYERLLRSILMAQPLQQIQQGLRQGVAMQLRQSSVKGVSMLAFEMELVAPGRDAVMPADTFLDLDRVEGGGTTVEVWEAVVEVREGGTLFVPVSVKRKHSFGSTLTLSPSALALALGHGNATQPLGSESSDVGLARAAAQEPGGRDEL